MSVTGIAVGKTGLESKLDKNIIGEVGFQRYEVNAYGKRIRQIKLDEGLHDELKNVGIHIPRTVHTAQKI